MYVLQRDASRFPSRETAPTELLPGSHTPHLRSSCLSVLHCEHCEAPVCFTCAYSFHVPTSRMCPRVPAALLYAVGLMEGFLGKLDSALRCDLTFQSSTPLSQVTMLFLASLWITLPFAPVFIAPQSHKHAFMQCRKTNKDTVLIACPRAPSSSDHLVSTHFLLISCIPLYKN